MDWSFYFSLFSFSLYLLFSIFLVLFPSNSGLINRVDKCFHLFLKINHIELLVILFKKFDRIVKCHCCSFLKLLFVKESPCCWLLGNSPPQDFEGKWSGDIYYSDSGGDSWYSWREHVRSPAGSWQSMGHIPLLRSIGGLFGLDW